MRRKSTALDRIMVRQRLARGAYIPARFGPLAHFEAIALNAERRARGAK